MGTTRSFYFVANTGQPPDSLREKLAEVSRKSDKKLQSLYAMMEAMILREATPEQAEQAKKIMEESRQGGGIPGLQSERRSTATAIAYREEAKWLPLFDEMLCDGYTASGRDALSLSNLFGAPVLIFALYDSDVLFCSYGDAASGGEHNFAKPNHEWFEEYDDELYSKDFPGFLLELCDPDSREKLKEAWNEADVVFADDRMQNMCAILGIKPIYFSENPPEGHRFIFARQN